MSKKKEYPIICPSCNGTGLIIRNYNFTVPYVPCNACNGTGKVICTETCDCDCVCEPNTYKYKLTFDSVCERINKNER